MNEHPNLVLVNKFFNAYSSNSIDELEEIFHADVKWHIPGRHPLSGIKKWCWRDNKISKSIG
jgi:Ketosteroid isomerase-related protein